MSMKKLGFGLMRLPMLDGNNETAIDLEKVKQMVDLFLQRGFTYFDTALMYCGGKSESAVKEVLTSRYPRESFQLATKLHAEFIETLEDRDRVFEEQCERTGVSWFDYYLLHDINAVSLPKMKKLDCFRWIREKKAQGKIRHMGFSFHDSADLLDKVLTEYPDFDFVQLQINYLDWESEGVQSRRCYETAVRHGKKVIVMEPVKGGTLANVPKRAEEMFRSAQPEWSIPSWAIRFAASLEQVMMVLSGMSTLEQLEDNTGFMSDFKPLSQEERGLVLQAADIINEKVAIPCTGCAYCVEGCPQRINIPRAFALYNTDKQECEKDWTPQGEYYENMVEHSGKASDCIGCGQCETMCPQHLPIIDWLKTVAKHFE